MTLERILFRVGLILFLCHVIIAPIPIVGFYKAMPWRDRAAAIWFTLVWLATVAMLTASIIRYLHQPAIS